MRDLELRFCARGRIADRAALEIRAPRKSPARRRVGRDRAAVTRLVFRAPKRRTTHISLDRARLAKRFVQSGDEPLIDGLQALAARDFPAALDRLAAGGGGPDAAFLHGALALRDGRLREAVGAFEAALQAPRRLGTTLALYGVEAQLWLGLTRGLDLRVRAERASLAFAQAQISRELGRADEARAALEEARRYAPHDVVICLCLAELLLFGKSRSDEGARRVLRLSDGVANTSSLNASLLLFRARALRRLGRSGASLALCSRVLARASERPRPLMLAFRVERAGAASDLGNHSVERRTLNELKRDAPGYLGVQRPIELGVLA